MQTYLEWCEIPCIGIYSGHFLANFGFYGVGCTSRAHTQYKVKASNRLGSDNQESSNCHNHACNKIELTIA